VTRKNGTLSLVVSHFFIVLFALMQKVRKKIKANPNPSGSLARLTPPPVWLALRSFYLVAYKHVSKRHKCLVVAGIFLPVRGMPYSKKLQQATSLHLPSWEGIASSTNS
jgi:hypothetical protein